MTTTTDKAAVNGTATTSKNAPAQREHGMDRLREEECYLLSSLIEEALDETSHLVRKVRNKTFNRTLDYDGSKGTAPLDRDQARDTFTEARDCAQVAIDYLCRALNALNGEPPF
jgi:hypothetical protein